MSSFTIAKKEYIKAAGLVAGIAETINRGSHNFWLYDYESNRNSTAEDYYNHFAKFYEMNAIAVQEQYRDTAPNTDANDYKTEFEEYRQKGQQYAMKSEFKRPMMELRAFFHSAIYQTEKDAYMWQMQLYFNRILDALIGFAIPWEAESWGDLAI